MLIKMMIAGALREYWANESTGQHNQPTQPTGNDVTVVRDQVDDRNLSATCVPYVPWPLSHSLFLSFSLSLFFYDVLRGLIRTEITDLDPNEETIPKMKKFSGSPYMRGHCVGKTCAECRMLLGEQASHFAHTLNNNQKKRSESRDNCWWKFVRNWFILQYP